MQTENKKEPKKSKEKIREMIMYIIFGALTTGVNWVTYFLVTRLLGMPGMEQGSSQYMLVSNIGNVTAWIVSVLFAFVTNKKYVFQSKADARHGGWREFMLFVSARITSFLLFDVALFNLLQLLGMNADLDKLLMNVLVILFNYFASSLVIFKKKPEEKPQDPTEQP